MEPTDRDLKTVFCEAIDLPEGPERIAYLDGVCPVGTPLRARVEALLQAHEASGRFLGSSPGPVGKPAAAVGSPEETATQPDTGNDQAPDPDPLTAGAGTRIGPYVLLRTIGEGGMGVVYEAQQTEPVRRTVALKVIKPGMDSQAVTARFEAERQALALMDHPHIARVFDAGTTPAGHPFFVMELVHGVPITAYCDDARLTPRQRLELFIPVCQAVQHAHQKGVIHRDIKPSNVLVTVVDGKPVPKVIDFGIAKAINQRLTERTLLTGFGAIVGTPEYMSPEQAGASPDVDARTDVYGLGVLLYELLTGTTPLDGESLRQAAFDEVLRRVRKEEPAKPSTRLSDPDARSPSVATLRGMEPSRLSKLMRGDLDWIVMRALEKDRARRYETPSAFARDVQRYLDGDPVEAGPPSRLYRLKKFARKHRAGLTTASAFALLLLAATAISTREARRAARAEQVAERRLREVEKANKATALALRQSESDRKRAEAVSQFLVEAFRSPDPKRDGYQIKVADVLDGAMKKLEKEFTGSPATKGDLLDALGQTYWGLGLQEKADAAFEKCLSVRETVLGPDHPDIQIDLRSMVGVYGRTGREPEAVSLLERIVKQDETRLGPDHRETLEDRNALANFYMGKKRYADAVALLEPSLKRSEAKLGRDHLLTQVFYFNVAKAYIGVYGVDDSSGSPADRAARKREALKHSETRLGPDHPVTQNLRGMMAPPAAAESPGRRVVRQEAALHENQARLGPDHPDTLASRERLANAYLSAGRSTDAFAMLEEVLKQKEARFGLDHPNTLSTRNQLAIAYENASRHAAAVRLLEQNLKLQEARFGPGRIETRQSQRMLAQAYHNADRHAEEIALLEQILAQQNATQGSGHLHTVKAGEALAFAYLRHGRGAEGVALLEATLKSSEARTGPDSRYGETEMLRNNLAGAYFYIGRDEDGIALYDSMFRQKQSKFGLDHVETLIAQAHLGEGNLRAGHVVEGVRLMEDALRRARGRHDAMERLQWIYGTLAPFYEKSGQFASAERLYREKLAFTQTFHGTDSWIMSESPPVAVTAADSDLLGQCLLRQGKWSEAEPLLRTSLASRKKTQPDYWGTYYNRSTLGGALLGQARYAEAQPLVLLGYEGMKARESTIPPRDRARLTEAALRVVKLYEQWGKTDQATEWKEKLGLADLPADVFTPP